MCVHTSRLYNSYIRIALTGSIGYCCVTTCGLELGMFYVQNQDCSGVSSAHWIWGWVWALHIQKLLLLLIFSWPYIQLPEPLESHGPQLKKLGLTWTSWKINVTLSKRESCGMEGLVAKEFKGTLESLGISFQFWYLCCSTSSSLKWRRASVATYTWRKWWRR